MAQNEFAVAVRGLGEIVFFPPDKPVTTEQALNLAAWLLVAVRRTNPNDAGEAQTRLEQLVSEAWASWTGLGASE